MSEPQNEEWRHLLRRHAIPAAATMREALKALNNLSGSSMTLFVTDRHGRMEGTITDGDIRRALLKGRELSTPLEEVMHRNFLFATEGDDLPLKIAEGRKKHIDLLPVLQNGIITDILDLKKVKTSLPLDAVLMAGGRGERLRPLTDSVPKPLLPVGGKPIIDYNVEELEACGVKKIFVTVNYMAESIERHFALRRGRAKVTCVREPKRLGTMGSIALVEGISHDNVMMMNSDLLTNIDFEELYLHHKEHDAALTMAAVPYSVSVPFAVMHMEGTHVTGLEEKPTFNYFANAGVYILKTEILGRVKKGEYLDAPDFIAALIDDGLRVECYPADGTWIDIGSPDDYRHANELMGKKKV